MIGRVGFVFQCRSLQGAVKFLRCRVSVVAVRTLTEKKIYGFVEKTSVLCVLLLVLVLGCISTKTQHNAGLDGNQPLARIIDMLPIIMLIS